MESGIATKELNQTLGLNGQKAVAFTGSQGPPHPR